jgi:Sec-independent protein translocase protein TatA
MFNLDPSKLLVIAVVTIIVLGPERLPHFARQIGGAWRSLSEFRQRMESEVRNSLLDLPSTTELANYARSPSALLDRLSSTTPAHDKAADSLRALGDLPPIALSDQAHWTTTSADDPTTSYDSRRRGGAPGTDAERVWLKAQAPFVGDATLN